jgi:hypothetical protein
MENYGVWPVLREALMALRGQYGPKIDHAAESFGIPYGEWYGWLMAAHIFEPLPVSVPRLRVRAVFTSPARLSQCLATGERLGLLSPAGTPGEFWLTEHGHAAVKRLIETAYHAMLPLEPLPEADLARLVELLYGLVMASLAAPEPPGKTCLRVARRYDPGTAAPLTVRLDQYLSDLDAYRDDARLAVWPGLGVSGQAWDAFTLLWRAGAASLDQVAARLARRGYTRDEYAAALQELADRGWVAERDGQFALTPAGATALVETEEATDRCFYAPWAVLSDADVLELGRLLIGLRDNLGLPA